METRARPSKPRRVDPDLLARARAGEREAFDALLRPHVADLVRLLHRLAGNREDAEDLTQECLVRAWGALCWYRGESGLRAWLAGIGVHVWRDHLRRDRRRPRRVGLEAGDDGAHAGLRAGPQVGEEVGARELDLALDDALRRLPERLRTALVLRVLEGLEYARVAELTGVTESTARRHVMHARRRLQLDLAPWLGGGGR